MSEPCSIRFPESTLKNSLFMQPHGPGLGNYLNRTKPAKLRFKRKLSRGPDTRRQVSRVRSTGETTTASMRVPAASRTRP